VKLPTESELMSLPFNQVGNRVERFRKLEWFCTLFPDLVSPSEKSALLSAIQLLNARLEHEHSYAA